MTHRNDWNDLDADGAVVLDRQERTAVYQSKGGFVVIRQEVEMMDDAFVSIQPEGVLTVIRAMIEAAELDVQVVPLSALRVVNEGGEILAPFDAQAIAATRPDTLILPKPKDRTAAERKRRQRQKQKQVTSNVTPLHRDIDRDSVTATPELPEIFEQYSGRHAVAAE